MNDTDSPREGAIPMPYRELVPRKLTRKEVARMGGLARVAAQTPEERRALSSKAGRAAAKRYRQLRRAERALLAKLTLESESTG